MEYSIEYVSTVPNLNDAVSDETKDRFFKRAKKPLKKMWKKDEHTEKKSNGHSVDILV